MVSIPIATAVVSILVLITVAFSCSYKKRRTSGIVLSVLLISLIYLINRQYLSACFNAVFYTSTCFLLSKVSASFPVEKMDTERALPTRYLTVALPVAIFVISTVFFIFLGRGLIKNEEGDTMFTIQMLGDELAIDRAVVYCLLSLLVFVLIGYGFYVFRKSGGQKL